MAELIDDTVVDVINIEDAVIVDVGNNVIENMTIDELLRAIFIELVRIRLYLKDQEV